MNASPNCFFFLQVSSAENLYASLNANMAKVARTIVAPMRYFDVASTVCLCLKEWAWVHLFVENDQDEMKVGHLKLCSRGSGDPAVI